MYFEKDLVEPKHLQSAESNVSGKKHVQNVRFPRSKLLDDAFTQNIIGVPPKSKADIPPTNDAVHKECNREDDLATKDEFAVPGIFLHVSREKYFQVTEYKKYGRKLAETSKEDGVVVDELIL